MKPREEIISALENIGASIFIIGFAACLMAANEFTLIVSFAVCLIGVGIIYGVNLVADRLEQRERGDQEI